MLVVDDHPINRLVLLKQVNALGYACETAEGGKAMRKVLAGANPRVALIEDNTDQFSSSALGGALTEMLQAYNSPAVPPRRTDGAALAMSTISGFAT